jgi:hypothetical protein
MSSQGLQHSAIGRNTADHGTNQGSNKQSAKRTIKGDKRQLLADKTLIRQDKRDLRAAKKSGDPAAIKAAELKLQQDTTQYRQDKRDLHADMVAIKAELREHRQDRPDRTAALPTGSHIGN